MSINNADIAEITPQEEVHETIADLNENDTLRNSDATKTSDFKCTVCNQRSFNTYRGLNQHLPYCLVKKQKLNQSHTSSQPVIRNEEQIPIAEIIEISNFKWGNKDGTAISKEITEAYEKVVYWRKNLFMLPTGAIGKEYIRELTRLFQAWTYNTPESKIAMKAVHLMPNLLLQKPSKTSKTKDHVKALERRLVQWKKGEILNLLLESETIQQRLPNINRKKSIAQLSKKFERHMAKGNINGALKILTNNMADGILPLTDETLTSSAKNIQREKMHQTKYLYRTTHLRYIQSYTNLLMTKW
jgi:hypothetical protein